MSPTYTDPGFVLPISAAPGFFAHAHIRNNPTRALWTPPLILIASLFAATVEVQGAGEEVPAVLTPKPSPRPRINGAMIFGVRPGHPLLYTIAATGNRPMRFAAEGLPAGLTVDDQTGRLGGATTVRGEHVVTLRATNELGFAERKLRIVVGDRLALTPHMGWNSWYIWTVNATDKIIRDAADAMVANGIGPDGRPDRDFTPAKGSAMTLHYIEQHLAPSIRSRQLITAAGLSPAADKRPHIVFVTAEQEYETCKTLPAFAKKYLEKDFRCTYLNATGPEGTGKDDIPGLDALDDADLLVLSARRRALPVVQMDHLEKFIRAGKPLVALRTSAVAFQAKAESLPGCTVWDRFDQEVLGCNYLGYNPKSRRTGCDVWIAPGAVGHAILRGVAPTFHSRSWIYRQRPLAATTETLLTGCWSKEDPDEPVAWTNTYQDGRIFYTTLGHPGDFQIESFNRLLLGAIYWAMNLPTGKNP
jgi:hypothetical protein